MANHIYLYYTNSYPRPSDGNLTGAAPDGGNITGDEFQFYPLRMFPFQVQSNEDTGRMHGGILYSNKLDSRYSHTVYLQPKAITTNAKAFLEAFWVANFKYIKIVDAGSGLNNVRQVHTGGGKMPLSRINENKYLKEITLELTEVLPHGN